MGIQLANSHRLENLIKQYHEVRTCVCDGYMVPSTIELTEEYIGTTLVLKNFPVFKCLDCDEINYDIDDLSLYIKLAKQNYDEYGQTVFEVPDREFFY